MSGTRTVRSLGLATLATALAVVPLQSADAAAGSSLSVRLSATSVSAGERPVISGQVSPRKLRTVSVQRYSSGKWRVLTKLRTTSTGKYSVRLTTSAAGRFSYRVQLYATSRYRGAVTGALSLNVVKSTKSATPLGSRSAYSLIFDDEVVRWNPCTAITYRVNPNGAPAGWESDIKGALSRITTRAGLKFDYRGTTTALPGVGTTPDAKLLIGYARPGQSPRLTRADGLQGVAGTGGVSTRTVSTAGGVVWQVTDGFALLNLDVINGLPGGFGIGRSVGYQGTRGQLVMHELGHAMGLGHAPSADTNRTQVMYPAMSRKYAEYGAGDITGLTRVGASNGCITPAFDPLARILPRRASVSLH